MKAQIVKCICNQCEGHIEFDSAELQASQQYIECPHCGTLTLIAEPPPILFSKKRSSYKPFLIGLATVLVLFAMVLAGVFFIPEILAKRPYSQGFSMGGGQAYGTFYLSRYHAFRDDQELQEQAREYAQEAHIPETQITKYIDGFRQGYESKREEIKSPFGKGFLLGVREATLGEFKRSPEALDAMARGAVGTSHAKEFAMGYEAGWSSTGARTFKRTAEN